MTRQIFYRYLGTNGIIESPVHLEDIFYVRINYLKADAGKILTNGEQQVTSIRVSDEEIDKWKEINKVNED